jgi:hypothetical protein
LPSLRESLLATLEDTTNSSVLGRKRWVKCTYRLLMNHPIFVLLYQSVPGLDRSTRGCCVTLGKQFL